MSFTSTTETPTRDADVNTAAAAAASLSVHSKPPLTVTKSALESLVVEKAPSQPPDVTSASGDASGGSVVVAHGGQKTDTPLSASRPSKCE